MYLVVASPRETTEIYSSVRFCRDFEYGRAFLHTSSAVSPCEHRTQPNAIDYRLIYTHIYLCCFICVLVVVLNTYWGGSDLFVLNFFV